MGPRYRMVTGRPSLKSVKLALQVSNPPVIGLGEALMEAGVRTVGAVLSMVITALSVSLEPYVSVNVASAVMVEPTSIRVV